VTFGRHEGRLSVGQAMRRLTPEQRLTAIAAAGLLVSLFTPWWRDPVLGLSHWAVNRFSFSELALVLVGASVLLLVYRRAEGRAFHLPLADSTLAAAAGAWSLVLVVARLLDPPTRTVRGQSLDYEVRWGVMLCIASAVLLIVAGVRSRRRYHHGEPEAIAADEDADPTLRLDGGSPAR
jgi:hypothetical protein